MIMSVGAYTRMQPEDNIAPIDDVVPEITDEEYLLGFSKLGERYNTMTQLLATLPHAAHDQERIQILTKYVDETHYLLGQVLSQMIEMNNVFGSK